MNRMPTGISAKHDAALIANGYEPVAVFEKKALGEGWSTRPNSIEAIAAERQALPRAVSTGLRTGRLAGIDIDILDTELASKVEQIAADQLGATLLRRVGSKGCILCYRNEAAPLPKIQVLSGDAAAKVEILGIGQQFVAYGDHPGTGKPYKWMNADLGGEPLQAPLQDLPEVTPPMLLAFAEAVAECFRQQDFPKVEIKCARDPDAPPINRSPASGEPVGAKALREAAGFLDPGASYHDWRDMVAAIGTANCEEAWDIAHEFSEGKLYRTGEYKGAPPANYTGPDAIDAILYTMGPKPGGITVGSLFDKARGAGWKGSTVDRTAALQQLVDRQSFRPGQDDAAEERGITSSGWRFTRFNAVEDSKLPPFKYFDAAKLWIDSPERTITQVIGPPKGLKTSFVMGEKFELAKAGKIRVAFLALEGQHGMRTVRLQVLAEHHGVPLKDLAGIFEIVDVAKGGPTFDITNSECVDAFAAWLRANRFTDLDIDTQFRSAGNSDENSAQDARQLWNNAERLRRDAACNITFTHHTGKDPSKGGRGSSADFGAVDTLIGVTRDRDAGTATAQVIGRKDGADNFEVGYRVLQIREDTPPLLVRMSDKEFAEASASRDPYSAAKVKLALLALGARTREKAQGTFILAVEMLKQAGSWPADPIIGEQKGKGFAKRLMERATSDLRVRAYCTKDGEGKTAPWKWWIPDAAELERGMEGAPNE